jgi:hypothetical protein
MASTMRFAMVLVSALAAANCTGSSPTAPTPVGVSLPPVPAPVSQTMTGTWSGSGQSFTVTQIGDRLTGALAPATTELPGSITVVDSATITGVVAGDNVTLTRDERFAISGATTMNCTGELMFTGTLSGNSLRGTLTAGPAPIDCGGALPPVPLPIMSGPIVYTRQ